MYLFSSFCLPFINISYFVQFLSGNTCSTSLHDFRLRDQTCLITPSCFAYKILSSYFQFCHSISVDSLSLLTRSASNCRIIKSRFRSANHNLENSKRTRLRRYYWIFIKYDMAQSANKRTPLAIDAFWDKPRTDHPRRREKWRVQYKLALLAKENIFLDIQFGPKPEMMDLLGPIYKETIIGSSAQPERERNARNA